MRRPSASRAARVTGPGAFGSSISSMAAIGVTSRTLEAMNDYFVPRFTEFPDARAYLEGYSVVGEALASLAVPTHIISSRDDPVILAADLPRLAVNPLLAVELTEYGGHCGFIENYRLHSWIDRRILALLTNDAT